MMSQLETTSAPPQREDSRAIQILRAARELFLKRGWDGFNMESIADASDCSRPLVYKHYACKEEVMLALALESKRRRERLCERALAFTGRPRERMLAVSEIEQVLVERDLPIEMFVASTQMRAKTSEYRQKELKRLELLALAPGIRVIKEALRVGDLVLPDNLTAEDFLFFLWASLWGAASIMRSDTPIHEEGITKPLVGVGVSIKVLLDGMGWQPLSTDWDYAATRERVYREAFPPEVVKEILQS